MIDTVYIMIHAVVNRDRHDGLPMNSSSGISVIMTEGVKCHDGLLVKSVFYILKNIT